MKLGSCEWRRKKFYRFFVATELWGHFWIMFWGIQGRVPIAPLGESKTGLLSLLVPP